MRFRFAFGALFSLLLLTSTLTGCGAQPVDSSNEQTPIEESTPQETNSPETSSSPQKPTEQEGTIENSVPGSALPPEWSNDEREMFELYASIYKSNQGISLEGKRALMDNAYLICDAYSQGFSRLEIQSATSGGSVTPQMADDWMTLSVTYICPEFFDEQMR